jgi:hypothetical protein
MQISTISFTESNLPLLNSLDLCKQELVTIAKELTALGSKLYPENLVKQHVHKCDTHQALEDLESKMLRNRKLEVLGSQQRIWDRMI